MDTKKVVKSLLLVFVVVSLAVLVYRELSPKSEGNARDLAVTKEDTSSFPKKALPAPEGQPVKEPTKKKAGESPLPQAEAKAQHEKVIAYYFHGTFRCPTCRTIEKYSKEAIEYYFANELNSGTLEFRPVNIDEPDNKHFVHDYQLVTRSLVLSLVSDGKEKKWVNLADIWKLVSERDRFFQYVKNETEKFLKET